VKLTHDGLSIWYGTPDAPAPFDQEVVARDGVSLVVGVSPANPTNSVAVQYRVDRGFVQSVPGAEVHLDPNRDAQYFVVRFPTFTSGSCVEYWPSLRCGGRQVPSAHQRFPRSAFHLAPKTVTAPAKTPAGPLPRSALPAPELTFMADIDVRLARVDYVGDTPEGMRIDFHSNEGRVVGRGIRGRLVPGAVDHMHVRRDGVGIVNVHLVIALEDGAELDVEQTGSVDFGPDGYAKALAHRLPSRNAVVVNARIATGHPKYLELNRQEYVAIGETDLDALFVGYQLYALRRPPVTPRPAASRSVRSVR
jgi:hypothetical protein